MDSYTNNPLEDNSQSIPGLNSAFVLVPSCFWENLNQDQFKAQLQIYQSAYEKARQHLGSEADSGALFFDI
jgi:hypothetical protein